MDKPHYPPRLPVPRMVIHGDLLSGEMNHEEPRGTVADFVAEQRSARVKAELSGHLFGLESPGRVHMAAAVEVRAYGRKPSSDGLGVNHALPFEFATVGRRGFEGIVA